MKLNLSDAEKTALANYLAEKDVKKNSKIFNQLGADQNGIDIFFKKRFEHYNNILKETDDY